MSVEFLGIILFGQTALSYSWYNVPSLKPRLSSLILLPQLLIIWPQIQKKLG